VGRTVILTGTWDAATRARAVAVASALAAAGVDTGVIAPVSPAQTGLPETVSFLPARRHDDAALALSRLAADGPLLIECHDAAAARCALLWRTPERDGCVVLLDASAALTDPAVGLAVDAVLAPTHAHAARCRDAGIAEDRVAVAPTPIVPQGVFEPGAEAVLCLTPIAPGRGLLELTDAWAASLCGSEHRWQLRFCGPVEDAAFAVALARRAASCAGVLLSERLSNPENDIAGSAVIIDPDGGACPSVLQGVARGRAVFAPAGSPTAEAACPDDSPFAYDARAGLRGVIGMFDLVADRAASEFAPAGMAARERLLRVHAPAHAVPARHAAHGHARALTPPPLSLPDPPPTWGGHARGRQSVPGTERLLRAMLACHSEGLRRVALYGAGEFVKGCADALCEPPLELIGFIDDDPAKRGKRVWGYPVLCPDVALTADLDAVILTAPAFEQELWQRTAWFRQARIRVIPLVREHAEIFASRAA
jgi:hypothetical protein